MQGKIQISTWVSGLSRSGYKAALHLYIVNDINDIIAIRQPQIELKGTNTSPNRGQSPGFFDKVVWHGRFRWPSGMMRLEYRECSTT